MRRLALCLMALFACAAITQSHAAAPFGGATRSGGFQSGARVGGTRGAAPATAPRAGGLARPGFTGGGLRGPGLPGRFPTLGRAREGRRDFDRFGRGFIGGGFSAFVPLPGLLGLPYYDGFEYPYFYPDTAAPYIDDLYGFPAPYLPPAAGYALPPQTDGLPPQAAGAAPSGPQVWYYCQDPMGYYPYIRDCNSAWQAVPASVLPPPTPQ